MPDRYQNSQSGEKDEGEEGRKSPDSPDLPVNDLSSPGEVHEVVEEEEVVVLTNNIGNGKVINISEVIQEKMEEKEKKETEVQSIPPANSPNR